jgi:hypothetical protein
VFSSTLNLIDLAGSESANAIIDPKQEAKTEMSCINKVPSPSTIE